MKLPLRQHEVTVLELLQHENRPFTLFVVASALVDARLKLRTAASTLEGDTYAN